MITILHIFMTISNKIIININKEDICDNSKVNDHSSNKSNDDNNNKDGKHKHDNHRNQTPSVI